MILWSVGFESTVVEYERATRAVGESNYDLRRLLQHALSGLFFTTSRVLHWVIWTGPLPGDSQSWAAGRAQSAKACA